MHHPFWTALFFCSLIGAASATAADDSAPPTHSRATAVMDRPPGGEATQPVAWRSLAIASNGKTLVGSGILPGVKSGFGSAARSGVVAVWQADSGKLKANAVIDTAYDLAISADNKAVIGRSSQQTMGALAGRQQTALMHWSLNDPKPTLLILDLNPTSPLLGHQFLAGRKFGTATATGFFLWDYKLTRYNNKLPKNVRDPLVTEPASSLPPVKAPLDPNQFDRKVRASLGISADGSLWVIGLAEGAVEGWDLKSGRQRFHFTMETGPAQSAALSADGKTIAVATAAGRQGPAVLEIRSGDDGAVIKTLAGGPRAPLTNLALTPAGTVLAAGASDGSVTLWDVSTGLATDRLAGHEQAITSVAISSGGTIVATADGAAAKVWDLERIRKIGSPSPAAVAAPRTEDSGTPSGEISVLSRGPLAVNLQIDGKSEPRELLGLTPARLSTRKAGELRFQVDQASTGKVREIVTKDGKISWKLDAAKKSFTGPVYSAPPREAPQAHPAPFSPEQLQTYLYLDFLRLKNRGAELVHDPVNEADLADLQSSAKAREQTARSRNLNGRLANLYARLSLCLDIQKREARTQQQVVEEHEEEIRRLNAAREAERRNFDTRRLVGFAALFIGAAPTSVAVTDPFGQTWNVETGVVSEDLAMQGLTSMFNTSLDESRQKQLSRAAENMANETMRNRLTKSLTAEQEASDAILADYKALSGEPFAIADLSEISTTDLQPPDKGAKAALYEPLFAKLDSRAAREKDRLGRPYPFTLAEAEYLRALTRPADDLPARIANIRERADRVAQLIDLVPGDSAFDSDRAELLARAGTLALRAAYEQVGPQRWSDAFNAHADAARVYFEQALACAPHDAAGRWREQLAWALVLSGRGADGLKLADAVAALRRPSSRFVYQLARARCSLGQIDQGYNDLEDAVVKLGFQDLVEAQNATDFPQANPRFKKLLHAEVELLPYQSRAPAGTSEFQVLNRSKFTLRNARVRVIFRGTDVKGKMGNREIERTVEEWEAGEKLVVKVKPEYQVFLPPRVRMPQPEARVIVTTPRQGSANDKLE